MRRSATLTDNCPISGIESILVLERFVCGLTGDLLGLSDEFESPGPKISKIKKILNKSIEKSGKFREKYRFYFKKFWEKSIKNQRKLLINFDF